MATKKRKSTAKRKRTVNAPARRKRVVSKAKPIRRRPIRAKKKMPIVSNAINAGKGTIGGGVWYGVHSGFAKNWSPAVKLLLGVAVGTGVSFVNGGAGAGVAGASAFDALKGMFSPGTINDNGNVKYVPANTFKACGMDQNGKPVLQDRKSRYWTMNDKGVYALSKNRPSMRSVNDSGAFALQDSSVYALNDGQYDPMGAPDIAGDYGYSGISMLPNQ